MKKEKPRRERGFRLASLAPSQAWGNSAEILAFDATV